MSACESFKAASSGTVWGGMKCKNCSFKKKDHGPASSSKASSSSSTASSLSSKAPSLSLKAPASSSEAPASSSEASSLSAESTKAAECEVLELPKAEPDDVKQPSAPVPATHKKEVAQISTQLLDTKFGDREVVEPPDDCLCVINDKFKKFRAYITEEGECFNKYGDCMGYLVDQENMEAYSPDEEPKFWGFVDDVGLVFNSKDSQIGEVDVNKGRVRDSTGRTCCEIDREGKATGHSGEPIGHFKRFSFHLMNQLALYVLLLDVDFLVEKKDPWSA